MCNIVNKKPYAKAYGFCLFFNIKESGSVFFQEALELRFMAAELFLTARAIETFVCVGREPFGVKLIGYFPAEKQQKREPEKCIGIDRRDENKGCEHHCKIPVIDPAGRTATVFHKPRLERAEKQYTDYITDRIGDCDENQNALVDDIHKIQKPDKSVKCKPNHSNKKSSLPRLVLRFDILANRLIVPRELLLTAHTFQP
jgi:hypothetical protein